MITCRELIDFLADYIDGSLPASQRSVFEEHLRICPPCVDYLEMYRATLRLEKSARNGESSSPAADVPQQLKQAILAARKTL